jgi:hypothetical protein
MKVYTKTYTHHFLLIFFMWLPALVFYGITVASHPSAEECDATGVE